MADNQEPMGFTYRAYAELLALLRAEGYAFCDYHNHETADGRRVILRHDIDSIPAAALRLAELEASEGIHSTWFVLLSSENYNPMSPAVRGVTRELRAMGHEIGLHFDETAYAPEDGEVTALIVREARLLADLLGAPVRAVSMHCPSQAALEADWKLPGLVNTYGKTFFREYKYLSDSSRHWREPVLDIIRSGRYERLHILTHAFWYHETEESLAETARNYIGAANRERYRFWLKTFPPLGDLIREDELR